LGCLTVLAVGIFGLSKVRTSVKVVDLLAGDHPLIADYRWFEQHLGPLVPVEVIVHFRADSELDLLQRAEIVRAAAHQLRGMETLEGVTAASSFLPDIPRPGGLRQTFRRSVLRKRLETLKPQLIQDSWLHEDAQRQSWRISARVPAFGNIHYGELLDEMRKDVSRVLEAFPEQQLTATYTGLTPVVFQAQQALLDDLFQSFLTALILVSIVLMIVFRSLSMGVIALVPNIFPSVVLFGSMGLLGVPVDIGTVMTASVALGIAVDDAIHFLTWYRREQQLGNTRAESIQLAYRHAAVAMIQTTAICGLGLAVFAFTEFMPTRRFAWMMATLLFAALAGDLLLLPALLISPLGKLVARPKPQVPSAAAARPGPAPAE
jgi:predicted RND superfamily exporter protein